MTVPDICDLFGDEGLITVEVSFDNFSGKVRSFRMDAGEITRLINPETGLFYPELRLFGRLFPIVGYDIDPRRNRLTVRAGG
ncbi:hypothetical protein JCM14469_37370 [Desulfatiferula olefinivorans]